MHAGSRWNGSKPTWDVIKEVDSEHAFPALYVHIPVYDTPKDRFPYRFGKIQMSNFVKPSKGYEREELEFRMYWVIWKQCNQFDKVKNDFPDISSSFPRDLGTLDVSIPNVILLRGTTANEMSRLCTTKLTFLRQGCKN